METLAKTVRIFISSTFKDMHSERDYLVNVIFPRLREFCHNKGLELLDVDLRWGITEQEAKEDKVLEICLDEIEKCKPFFIGLLGERYGWVPDKYHVTDQPLFGWLKKFRHGHSVTALEIFQGVLNNPESGYRTFFYFRDPSFTSSVPDAKRKEMMDDESGNVEKLRLLKKDICTIYEKHGWADHVHINYPCRYKGLALDFPLINAELEGKGAISEDQKNQLFRVAGDDNLIDNEEFANLDPGLKALITQYCTVKLEGLEAFGEMVVNDLTRAILEEYPEDASSLTSAEQECRFHEHFIDLQTRGFIGRDKQLQQIAQYLTDLTAATPLVINGVPGSGKSSFMAMIVKRERLDHPTSIVIGRFIGISPGSGRIDGVIRSILHELANKTGGFDSKKIPDDYDELVKFFHQKLSNSTKKIILVIDALNQLAPENKPTDLNWLPKSPGQNIKIILSTLDDAFLTSAKKQGLPLYGLEGFSKSHQKALVKAFLGRYGKKLNTDQLNLLLAKKEAAKPLYLVIACSELRVFPRFEEISLFIEKLPGDCAGLFGLVFNRLANNHDTLLVKDALSFIACSRFGLFENELTDLLSEQTGSRLPILKWAGLNSALGSYVTAGGENNDGLINFFHQQLRFAVEEKYFRTPDEKAGYLSKLGHYGLRQYQKQDGILTNAMSDSGIYLYQANEPAPLFELLKGVFIQNTVSDFKNYRKIVDNFYSWVIWNRKFEEEKLLKSMFERLTETGSEELSTFLWRNGRRAGQTGRGKWILFLYEQRLKLLDTMLKKNPANNNYQFDKAETLLFIGIELDEPEKYLKFLTDAEEIAGGIELTILDVKNRSKVEDLLAKIYKSKAGYYEETPEFAKAGALYDHAITLMEAGEKNSPEYPGFLKDLAGIYSAFATFLIERFDDHKKGFELMDKAIMAMEQADRHKPENVLFRYRLGGLYFKYGQLCENDQEKAETFFMKAINALESMTKKFPERLDMQKLFYTANQSLGKLLYSKKKLVEGKNHLQAAIRTIEYILSKTPDDAILNQDLSVCKSLIKKKTSENRII